MSSRADQVVLLHDVLTAMVAHLIKEGLEPEILASALYARAREVESWSRKKLPIWWQWTRWLAGAIEHERKVKDDQS